MHIHELLPALGDVREVVHVDAGEAEGGTGESELTDYLRIPAGVAYRRHEPADAEKLDLDEGAVIVCLLGPAAPQLDPDAVAPVLDAMPIGGTALLLVGWPVTDLPYHRLLGPLGGASCQAIEAVPLEGAVAHHGAHAALVVRRVGRLAPPRPYLTGQRSGRTADADADIDSEAGLRMALRMANEYVLADLVARPMRARMADLERDLANREGRLREAEQRLAKAKARIAVLEASATYRVGQAVVRGARNPARAVVGVPRDLARIWRDRGNRGGAPPSDA
jgi:hypothetical protein